MTEASIILEEINRSGGHSAACHAQMYTMGALLRHGSPEQKARWLPPVARANCGFRPSPSPSRKPAPTPPRSGRPPSATATIGSSTASRIGRAGSSNPICCCCWRGRRRKRGRRADQRLEPLLVDLREARRAGTIEVQPVRTMFNYPTNQVLLSRSASSRRQPDRPRRRAAFAHIIDGWNAERILLASEAIGDGYWFVERATAYASEREVFGRPIGANQGVQFPLAHAYADVQAADLMRWKGGLAVRFWPALRSRGEHGQIALRRKRAGRRPTSASTSTAATASSPITTWSANSAKPASIQVAPVNNNLVLAFVGQHVLGLPKSY